MASSFRELLRPLSRLRYVAWKALSRRVEITLDTRAGDQLTLRPTPYSDYGVAYEIFVDEVYRLPDQISAEPVRSIVDLGANVGFSCLYWLRRYRDASVLAFEPHPGHFAQLQKNIERNGHGGRVTLMNAAAAPRDGHALLSDAGSGSTVGGTNGKGQLPVALRDLFSVCDAPPDLLKMDIEGGEFAILEDARFAALHPRVVVVEWHKTPAISDPEAWCVERFRALGYECLPISRLGSTGVMWAFEASSRDSNHRRASI